MTGLPKDPFMLFSVINTKLRDQYDSVEALCEDMNVDQKELERRLQSAGFAYSPDRNQFI
jgi:hypothetical protein